MLAALWLFWRSHADLGQNWSVSLEIRKDHRIVQHGVYRLIRHPMYASIWLWSIAQALLLANWLAGWSAVVPFAVNAYGRWLVGAHGSPLYPTQAQHLMRAAEADLDPPGPQPWRCFQVGAAIARVLTRSPWRVAVIASSSWSHSFLVAKHSLMFPDVESDRRYYEALRTGDWTPWRTTTIEEAEDRGHHELLNWFCLAGAMAELNRRPDESVFLESWISNSDKVFAVFRP